MIFKQRLFTILLGLLFATVLTDQASALYDPGVGRFCSRDPIGLVRQKGSYKSEMGLNLVDPSGNVSIELGINYDFDGCVGCGGVKQYMDITVKNVKDFGNKLIGQFAIIQYLCNKRSGNYCSSSCGQNCAPDKNRFVPKMDCCRYELLGVIEVTRDDFVLYCIAHDGSGLKECQKIRDNWSYKSFGDRSCHSVGSFEITSRIGIFDTEGWPEIWEMINNYNVVDYECGD